MGFSITIVEAIMVIASVVMASGFAAYAIYAGTSLQSDIMQNLGNAEKNMDTRLDIVYAVVNQTSGPSGPSPLFTIYVKNTGSLPISNFDLITVYAGVYGQAMPYSYNASATTGSGQFNMTDANGDGIVQVGEAAIIQVYNATNVLGNLYEAKVVPYQGISSSCMFSPP
jgi:archaellum component FlaG (FlaF/FlaG flagellin family)